MPTFLAFPITGNDDVDLVIQGFYMGAFLWLLIYWFRFFSNWIGQFSE